MPHPVSPQTATVVTPFDGAPDGSAYPAHFEIGDIVEGDLAEVAVAQGWAEAASQAEAAAKAGKAKG